MWRVLLWLFVWPSLVQAGMVPLAFEFDLAWQPGASYVVRERVVTAGVTTGLTRALPLATPARCQQADPAWTPETLCGTICLPPGDYSLSVYAIVADGRQTSESNVLDVDLTSTGLCTPPVPAPPSPPPLAQPPPPGPEPPWRAALLAGAAAVVATFPGGAAPSWLEMVNTRCVEWTVTGPCFCNPFTPCLHVEYWEPGWIVETVKRPGETHIPLLGPVLQAALGPLGLPAFGGGGAANATGQGQTNLQFSEAHVYTFPQLLGGPCTGCVPGLQPPTVHYASEVDPGWRTATAVATPGNLGIPLGVWGPLYPRGGKAIHSSEPVGSGICAARAMDIAFLPVGVPPNLETHVVLQPTGATTTCMQLASPIQTPCFTAGTPPMLWETGALSMRGTYVWIMWRKRSCCVPPDQVSCGITLPPLGGHGMNGCVPLSTP